MSKKVQVAIAFALSEPHQVRILQGIQSFAERQGNWAFTFSPEEFGGSIAALKRWPGHGIIATVTTEREARLAREMRIPVVNLSAALRNTGLPRVMVDQEAMGKWPPIICSAAAFATSVTTASAACGRPSSANADSWAG